jgi:hypothetical protein
MSLAPTSLCEDWLLVPSLRKFDLDAQTWTQFLAIISISKDIYNFLSSTQTLIWIWQTHYG